MMRKILFGAVALVALGAIGAPLAHAFTIQKIEPGDAAAAPLADTDERLPLFDHRFDRQLDDRSDGPSLRLPGGGTFQFYGGSDRQRGPEDSNYFGRMPDSVQPYAR